MAWFVTEEVLRRWAPLLSVLRPREGAFKGELRTRP
jgi:hypothetical protein